MKKEKKSVKRKLDGQKIFNVISFGFILGCCVFYGGRFIKLHKENNKEVEVVQNTLSQGIKNDNFNEDTAKNNCKALGSEYTYYPSNASCVGPSLGKPTTSTVCKSGALESNGYCCPSGYTFNASYGYCIKAGYTLVNDGSGMACTTSGSGASNVAVQCWFCNGEWKWQSGQNGCQYPDTAVTEPDRCAAKNGGSGSLPSSSSSNLNNTCSLNFEGIAIIFL